MADKVVSENPATLEAVGEVPVASPGDVEAAVEAAREAQPAWAAQSVAERGRVLGRFLDLLIAERDAVARLVTLESGKPVGESVAAELYPVADAVRYVQRHGPGVLEARIPLDNPLFAGRRSRAVREPVGVVGVIAPWNYPFGIPGTQAVFALFAGNAVVMKPSTLTPLTADLLADLLHRAGVPEAAFRIVHGPGKSTGDALVRADVDYLLFTGSVGVGHAVHAACAERRVPTCLELGGSDPAIVLEDANLEMAAEGIVWSRFTNCGQTCAAVKRVYAVDAVHDELARLVVEKTERLRVGDGLAPGVDVGPLITAAALADIDAQVAATEKSGAEVLTGGERAAVDLPGHFYRPTVLGGVSNDAPAVREETFGPALPILRAADAEEAVEMANASRFGLTASVWTGDVDRGADLARGVEAGTVTVNDHLYTYAAGATPWGGVKDSGHGRTHGEWGLLELTRLKHINTAPARTLPRSLRPPNLWWFPYEDDQAEAMGDGLALLYGKGVRGKAGRGRRLLGKLLGKRGL